MANVILTGDRPTGRLHLGHYVGSLRRRVELQNSGKYDKIFIMIADAQALTDNADNPEKVRSNILEVALDYLACGIDPEKTHILIQSQIPELCELTFYYMNLVTVSRLQRNPTVKTEIKMRNFEANIPVGFFTYPISQAADITLFKATEVPVGEDQAPMLEQTVEIVRRFNRIYGETLVEPKISLSSNAVCCRLPGTYTDPGHIRLSDPGKVEGNVVFTFLDAFCKDEDFAKFLPDYANLDELKDHYRRGGLGDVKIKKFLTAVLEQELAPIRERRKELQKDIPYVFEVLKRGTAAARETGMRTMEEVRRAMRINYFDDISSLY